jgi:hypothetical protein
MLRVAFIIKSIMRDSLMSDERDNGEMPKGELHGITSSTERILSMK